MEPFNAAQLTRALNFHGQQLQKMWEGEYGEHDLPMRNVKDLSFGVYGQRQKNLPFQDRGKRLKLQQFIVKHADTLFSNAGHSQHRFVRDVQQRDGSKEDVNAEDLYAVMPPFETYVNAERGKRLLYFSENVKMGDLILGTIVSKQQSGMMLKVLCTIGGPGGAHVKYAADINIKAFCPVANVIPAVDKKGVSRSYMMNDYVCCEVLEIIADTDKMVCGMKGTTRKPSDADYLNVPPLGLINTDDFPLVYKKSLDHKNEPYDSVLEKSVGFNNPNNIQYLAEQMDVNKHCSLMKGLNGKFPDNESAAELRQVQASKWAYRNVADGIDHFKAGKHVEAFQCLNKALNIDPKNVEGLVARGALFANSGNFQKAIEDFETALKLNPNHANARKYMGETLVALGRSYEDENKLDEARKAYQSCLSIIPFHEEAQSSLDFLKSKSATKNLIEPTELLLPNLQVGTNAAQSNKTSEVNDALKQLLKNEDEEKQQKKKKGKKKKRRNRKHSSSSSSSSSSNSDSSTDSDSSSSDSSSSSEGDSDFKKKKKKKHRREKQGSLSPLSKRMAMMDQSQDTLNFNFNKPAAFEFGFEQQQQQQQDQQQQQQKSDDYENKVRAFLQETKGDSDYEEKVRKFLEESSKWKKGDSSSLGKKKKRKKDKKSKKDLKKKKKDKKIKRKSGGGAGGFDLGELEDHKKLRDAIKKELSKEKRSKRHLEGDDAYFMQKSGYTARFMESLPDLEELESKLNAYYAMEKEGKLDDDAKRLAMDSPSPSREQKARLAVAEAAASANKWKMQIGPSTSGGNSRFKKKPERSSTDWPDDMIARASSSNSKSFVVEESPKNKQLDGNSKGASVRKQMEKSIKEPSSSSSKRPDSPPKKKPPILQPIKPVIPAGQIVLDKFGNFRLMTPPEMKKHEPLPPGRRPPEPPGRPRSDSRSPKRRSRSKFSRSRSSSGSRSRSRSYRSRSRSRSYYSRSRSRSGSYYSRSRSRSRSYSGDRRRYNRRGGFRGRYNNDRGTYYKPRFQNPRHQNSRGRGYNNNNRDSRYNDRDFRGRGRPFNRPYNNRRPRGRFRGNNNRDYRDRRYDRSRSRDRSRSYSRSDSEEQQKKVQQQEAKDGKVNKYTDGGDGDPVRHDGPLSEGEDRDDYNSSEKVVDRDAFAGKWADKEEANASGPSKEQANPPPEPVAQAQD